MNLTSAVVFGAGFVVGVALGNWVLQQLGRVARG